MKTTILPSARADIVGQMAYFADIGQEHLIERFLTAVRAGAEHISATPHAGSPRPMKNRRLTGLRTWPVDGFDDLKIYYLATADELTIVRILHGRRDIERVLSDPSAT